MRKKRTSATIKRLLRQGTALTLAASAGWLVWRTADWGAAARAVEALADNAQVATALLSAELGELGQDSRTGLERAVLSQSSLLTAGQDRLEGWLAAHSEDEPDPPVLPSAAPQPSPSPQASAPPEPSTTAAPSDIVGKTMVAGASSRYVSAEGLWVYNYTDYTLDIPQLLSDSPSGPLSQSDGPHVLIYHSHATEAYTMDGTDIYQESDRYRTVDPDYNMLRVGAEMKGVFESHGLEVIHDKTLYDYPVYTDAYTRSLEGVKEILEQHPTIQLVLDVHRDALEGADGTLYKTVAGTVADCAQVMLVVGSDAGGQAHDSWRDNLSLAVGIQKTVQDAHGALIRPIVLRSSRFNQHLSKGALLVEVGSHGNTLQEALAAARLTAERMAERLA